MTPQLGKTLVILGVGIVALGVFLWLGGGSLVSWFGRLPGDIRVERPGFRFYAPIVSMLFISLLLSALLWIIKKIGE